jgi:bifunctional non-homologous end joining protein LigD
MPRARYDPQLATLVEQPPSGDAWCHEVKFDGYRIGCHADGRRVALISRNGKDWTAAYPEIVDAVATLHLQDALLDGEVAIVLPDGRTSFQALQNASAGASGRGTLTYYVFDLLRLNGRSIETRPLVERKALLQAIVEAHGHERIRFAEHVDGDGQAFLERACRLGLEGIISKRVDRPYHHGRNHDWVKAKCTRRQEFVIGGFTDPEGTRAGLGALLIGYYDGRNFVFAGKVGTGFSHTFVVELRRRLDVLEQKTGTFHVPPPRAIARRAHWVRPELVCEVTFTEWTSDGMIRHPSFQGLRTDKRPAEVRRETGEAPPQARVTAPALTRTVAGVRLRRPEHVVYPDPSTSTIDLARYYEAVAEWILPHVAGRPLSLLRCPGGVTGRCSTLKPTAAHAKPPLRSVGDKKSGIDSLAVDDVAGLIALVDLDVVELRTSNCSVRDLQRPNRLVVAIEPGDKVPWSRVVEAARSVRSVFGALDLDVWCQTTGGRGLQVAVPLRPHATWQECVEFSRALSAAIAGTDPEILFTSSTRQNRAHRIHVDCEANVTTGASIAAFSPRALAGGPVAMPIAWTDIRPALEVGDFTVASVPGRLARRERDPWEGYWQTRQKLTHQKLRAVKLLGR